MFIELPSKASILLQTKQVHSNFNLLNLLIITKVGFILIIAKISFILLLVERKTSFTSHIPLLPFLNASCFFYNKRKALHSQQQLKFQQNNKLLYL